MLTDNMTRKIAEHHPPYVKHPDTVRSSMADMLIALFPAAVWSVFQFGLRALLIITISVVSSVAAEAAYELILKKTITIGDLSAVVTGLVLAFLTPSTTPVYIPAVGAVFAIIVVKRVFGGIGCNILNPALTGYVFLKLCFPDEMKIEGDLLAILKNGTIPDASLYDLIVGDIPGGIGEISSLLLVAGGLYLLFRRVINWRIPVCYILTVAAATLMLPNDINNLTFMYFQLFAGSLMLTAIYAATDPVTTPVTNMGRILFGVLCGVLTTILRYFGADADGAVYAVLAMNMLSGVLDRLTSARFSEVTDGAR